MNRQQRIGTLIFLMLCVACLAIVLLRNNHPSPAPDPQAEVLLNSRLESLRLPTERKNATDTTRAKKAKHPRKSRKKNANPHHPKQAPSPAPRSPLDEKIY